MLFYRRNDVLGGDCPADVTVVRAQPELFGGAASEPTMSRLMNPGGCRPRFLARHRADQPAIAGAREESKLA
jgi:hypothetical protein